MESTKEKLNATLKDALRSGDSERKSTLRGVLARIKQAEIDGQQPLDEAAVLATIQKEVKALQETVSDAEKAGRNDLIEQAVARIAILEAFLPQQLSRTEIEELARSAIAAVDADSPRQMGAVMQQVMPQVRGRADGKLVSEVVSALLRD